MRILHTSDWHLGRCIESRSRIPEQEAAIEDICRIIDEERVGLVIISGDVYDSINPPAEAEKLFYGAIPKLSGNGSRPVFVVPGNHDSPERLAAVKPLAERFNAHICGFPDDTSFDMRIGSERLALVAVPFPSERRLNEELSRSADEASYARDYSKKTGELIKKGAAIFKDGSVNIVAGHFYINGGATSDSERGIQLGGGYAVDTADMPDAQYYAMGHLHRGQRIGGREIHYSGSPLQYSKSETGYEKTVSIIDVAAGRPADVKRRAVAQRKPIEVWRVFGIDKAIEACAANASESSWVYLEIVTDRPVSPAEIKEMRAIRKDIVEITPILHDDSDFPQTVREREVSIEDEFTEFYGEFRSIPPAPDVTKFFLGLCAGAEE